MFQAIEKDAYYDTNEDQEQLANLTEIQSGYETNATDNSGYLEQYLEDNMTCADCEDYCGLDCFLVCLFFKDSDCKIPYTTFNYSGSYPGKYKSHRQNHSKISYYMLYSNTFITIMNMH